MNVYSVIAIVLTFILIIYWFSQNYTVSISTEKEYQEQQKKKDEE